jgi:hypothetical protein
MARACLEDEGDVLVYKQGGAELLQRLVAQPRRQRAAAAQAAAAEAAAQQARALAAQARLLARQAQTLAALASSA